MYILEARDMKTDTHEYEWNEVDVYGTLADAMYAMGEHADAATYDEYRVVKRIHEVMCQMLDCRSKS